MLKVGGNVRRAEVERILEGHVAVDDLDRLNLGRMGRSGTFLLERFALDERAEVPSAVRQPRADDVRARETDPADDRAPIDELADAVAERNLVDVNQRVALAREVDVAQLEAAKERPLEPADRQRRRQVVVGVPN